MRSLKDILPDAIAPPPAGTPGASADPPPDPRVAGCARCVGRRFVVINADPDSPEFGRAERCDCGGGRDSAVRERRLRAWAGIGADATFAVPDGTPEEARAWIADPHGWLAVVGPGRRAKTALCVAAVAAACQRGERGLYIPVPDLMEGLRAQLRPGGGREPDAAGRLPYAALAAFDGADRGTRTAWASERLDLLLEARWRDGVPTVIACENMPGPASGDDALLLAESMLDSETTLVELPAPAARQYTDLGHLPEERLRARGFGDFEVNPPQATAQQQRSLAAVVRAARAWARDHHAPALLVIIGDPGTGKTHLACAAIAERMDAGQRAVFANVPVLLDALRAAVGEDGPARLREWVIGADVLALDDLGAERSTAWGSEQMYEIVNSRYARGASTIITMNRGLDDLDRRIASRLSDRGVSDVWEVNAPDYRLARPGRD